MPPLSGYWIIVSGVTPTAFRSRRKEDLLPTLKQHLAAAQRLQSGDASHGDASHDRTPERSNN